VGTARSVLYLSASAGKIPRSNLHFQKNQQPTGQTQGDEITGAGVRSELGIWINVIYSVIINLFYYFLLIIFNCTNVTTCEEITRSRSLAFIDQTRRTATSRRRAPSNPVRAQAARESTAEASARKPSACGFWKQPHRRTGGRPPGCSPAFARIKPTLLLDGNGTKGDLWGRVVHPAKGECLHYFMTVTVPKRDIG
jgi:hypothetical protein